MSEKATDFTNMNADTEPAEQMLQYIWDLLSSQEMPDPSKMLSHALDSELFQKITDYAMDLRKLSGALNKGDLSEFVYSKGYVLSNLKALQAHLRHLTWQTRKIADGDFTQTVDFLGDFSTAFNEMTKKLEEYSNALKKLATFDPLTQIPNRLYLNEFLEKTFTNFTIYNIPFSIMLFDIDFFKRVNDTYGHDAGDQVLQQVSELISSFFRTSDIFARYGGEEFVAVLPGAVLDTAHAKAKQILERVRKTTFVINNGEAVKLTISIGISQSRPDDESWNDSIKRSDEALYMAKENGRDQAMGKEKNE